MLRKICEWRSKDWIGECRRKCVIVTSAVNKPFRPKLSKQVTKRNVNCMRRRDNWISMEYPA